jgi:DNA-binding CsgD family transcriptional regulator
MSSIEEFIERTQSAASAADLKRIFLSAVGEVGYENAVFARAQNRRLISIPWSKFPSGYLDVYKANEWDRIDPVVQRIRSARAPFRWSDTCARGGFSKEQHDFFEQCRELRVHSGITIPIHGPDREIDLISLSMRHHDKAPPDRLSHVHMMSVQYWSRYCELSDTRAPTPVALTAQETECLRWCKEGKTNWEIGEILKISEKTVEFHLSNTMRKLGADNRITAVIIGIKEGLISL